MLLNNQEHKYLLREDLDRWLPNDSKDHVVMCQSGQLLKLQPLPHHSEHLKNLLKKRSDKLNSKLRMSISCASKKKLMQPKFPIQISVSLEHLLSLSRLPVLHKRNSSQRMVVLRKRKELSLNKIALVLSKMIAQLWLTTKNQKRRKKKCKRNPLLQPAMTRPIMLKLNLKKLKWNNLLNHKLRLSKMNLRSSNSLI